MIMIEKKSIPTSAWSRVLSSSNTHKERCKEKYILLQKKLGAISMENKVFFQSKRDIWQQYKRNIVHTQKGRAGIIKNVCWVALGIVWFYSFFILTFFPPRCCSLCSLWRLKNKRNTLIFLQFLHSPRITRELSLSVIISSSGLAFVLSRVQNGFFSDVFCVSKYFLVL